MAKAGTILVTSSNTRAAPSLDLPRYPVLFLFDWLTAPSSHPILGQTRWPLRKAAARTIPVVEKPFYPYNCIGSVIIGSGGLTKAGNQPLVLTGANAYLEGKVQRAGTYGSSASGAANKLDKYFSGPGILSVTAARSDAKKH
jgi:hypothetical protein